MACAIIGGFMSIGLYLHIPFCVQKCAYCDFTSFAGQRHQMEPVVQAMQAEMARTGGVAIDTVYFGGGTPTVLPAPMLVSLLTTAKEFYRICPDAEITVEANPGTLDHQMLDTLREAGVNRLSIGAQAMQPALLQTLSRIHRSEDVTRSVQMARGAGYANINLDIMYGLPGQTPAMFRDTLEWALSHDPEHLSIYSLILEEGTPLFTRYANQPELLPTEDAILEMSDDALWMTEDAGLKRYEISNYAKPGYICRHNMGYWLRQDYIGIGCAAHSLLFNHRWANASTIEGYLAGEHGEESVVSEREARFERLLMGLRLVEGIPWEEEALFAQYKEKLRCLREKGLLDWNEYRLWATSRGLDLQNRVLMELMD